MNSRSRQPRSDPLPLAASLLALFLTAACQTTTSSPDTPGPAAGTATSPPAIIYVADFELWAQTIAHQESTLSSRPGPVGRVGKRLSGASTDPDARAAELVQLMSDTLIKDLTKAGLRPRRLPPGSPTPSTGWLVRGCLKRVDEGNRLQRSVIGFGEGDTEVQVVATLSNLAAGTPMPLYEVVTQATSGNKPGAAPTLAFAPWGAAIHYVRAGADVEKNIRQTAAQIATQVAQQVRNANTTSSHLAPAPSAIFAGSAD